MTIDDPRHPPAWAEAAARRYAQHLEQLGLMPAGTLFATEPATAVLLGVSGKTLRRWRRDQTGPPHRMIGPRIGYDLVELALWTARRCPNVDIYALDESVSPGEHSTRRRCTR